MGASIAGLKGQIKLRKAKAEISRPQLDELAKKSTGSRPAADSQLGLRQTAQNPFLVGCRKTGEILLQLTERFERFCSRNPGPEVCACEPHRRRGVAQASLGVVK